MTVNFHNIGVNPELISSILYQIYNMGRYKDTGEDKIVPNPSPSPTPPPTPPSGPEPTPEKGSFDMSFDNSFD